MIAVFQMLLLGSMIVSPAVFECLSMVCSAEETDDYRGRGKRQAFGLESREWVPKCNRGRGKILQHPDFLHISSPLTQAYLSLGN